MRGVRIDLALGGGGGEPCWLYLPLPGREPWRRLVGDAPFDLVELYATSECGDLLHPGEVALASPTSLDELLSAIGSELGARARVIDLALRLADGVWLSSHEERSLRLQAASGDPAAFAPWLERLFAIPAGRWRVLLPRLHEELLTGVELRLEASDQSFRVTAVRAGAGGGSEGAAGGAAPPGGGASDVMDGGTETLLIHA